MNNNIIIGKHTLESLTMGMYKDAKVIYREYVQNSVDALKDAISEGIIEPEEAHIEIEINKNDSNITILDNGIGISKDKVLEELLNIGNSTKNPLKSVGFRGIGRLSGLGYCKKLVFITSTIGESTKSIVSFDAVKLDKILTPGQYFNFDVAKTLEEITKYKRNNEEEDKHYFIVKLIGVKNHDDILEFCKVKNYLSQIAPVPYDIEKFTWSKRIKNKIECLGFSIDEFNLLLKNGRKKEKIYKPFADNFVSDRRRKMPDKIANIDFEYIKLNREIAAIMWWSESNFHGTINDEIKKGLRLRKNNFQIGNRFIMNNIFKEDRFNGWLQGEIFVFDSSFIPNARRDDFEKNDAYKVFLEQLKQVGSKLSDEIRKISKERNKVKNEKEIFNKLDYLIYNKSEYDYTIIDLIEKIPKREKKVLNKVFKIIDEEFSEENKNKFIDKILSNY